MTMTPEQLIVIAGICVFTAAMCKVFEQDARVFALLVKIAAAIAVMSAVISGLAPVLEELCSLYERSGAESEYMEILLKSLSVCYLTCLASDICRDSGENSLAVQAETAGKTALLIISLPLFEKAAELAISFLNKC